MFDSKEYAFSNIEVIMLGRNIGGFRGIKYKTSQENEELYGRGNEPRGFVSGNRKYEGELSVLQSELEALTDAAGIGKDITQMPLFDLIVTYLPEDSLTLVVDNVKGVKIGEFEKGMKQGDKFMEIALPFKALKIEYNI
jgi:hypothetical protein